MQGLLYCEILFQSCADAIIPAYAPIVEKHKYDTYSYDDRYVDDNIIVLLRPPVFLNE